MKGRPLIVMERETRFELATSTLARLHSTAELFPLVYKNPAIREEKTGPIIGRPPRKSMERETRFELATSTLARLHSTAELFPLIMEAASGFEPEDGGFADLCLTTWLCRLVYWSGKRDLNSRLQPWQGCTLPLSYSRPTGGTFYLCPYHVSSLTEHVFNARCKEGSWEAECPARLRPKITGKPERLSGNKVTARIFSPFTSPLLLVYQAHSH